MDGKGYIVVAGHLLIRVRGNALVRLWISGDTGYIMVYSPSICHKECPYKVWIPLD